MEQQHVILTGMKETIAGLKEFDKKNLAKFKKIINDELRQAKLSAQQLVVEASTHGDLQNAPLSNWKSKPPIIGPQPRGKKREFPSWDPGTVIQGISTSKAEGKVSANYTTSAGALINKSAAGYIFELAGRSTRKVSNDPRSVAFKKNLEKRFGPASRLVYKVVDRDRIRIEMAFYYALEQAKIDLQRALETQKD
jgi:hypothetical protein